MTLKFVIILQNLIKAYHTKSGKSKYDRQLTELDVKTTRIRSRVNGVLKCLCKCKIVKIVPIIIGALRTVQKNLKKWLVIVYMTELLNNSTFC